MSAPKREFGHRNGSLGTETGVWAPERELRQIRVHKSTRIIKHQSKLLIGFHCHGIMKTKQIVSTNNSIRQLHHVLMSKKMNILINFATVLAMSISHDKQKNIRLLTTNFF